VNLSVLNILVAVARASCLDNLAVVLNLIANLGIVEVCCAWIVEIDRVVVECVLDIKRKGIIDGISLLPIVTRSLRVSFGVKDAAIVKLEERPDSRCKY
jgi:hypothetical protein